MKEQPTSKFKILSYYHEIKQILDNKIPVPRSIKIFPSEVCDHKCNGCHSTVLHSKKHSFLDLNLYKRLVDEWVELGIESINFGGGGEPLMHPDIKEMIEYAGERGMAIGTLTNGTLLKNDLMHTILKYSTFIRIAMDAGTSQVYKAQHGVDKFDILIKKVKQLIDLRKELKSKTTVGLKFLVTKTNFNDIAQACKLASELGVDYIHFKATRHNSYEISNDMALNINKTIDKYKKIYANFNIFGDVTGTRVKVRCFLNMIRVVLNTDGNLYMCPAFHHRMESHRIGNVNKKKFADVWFSKGHLEKVRNIKMNECQLYDCVMHSAYDIVKEFMIDNNFLYLM